MFNNNTDKIRALDTVKSTVSHIYNIYCLISMMRGRDVVRNGPRLPGLHKTGPTVKVDHGTKWLQRVKKYVVGGVHSMTDGQKERKRTLAPPSSLFCPKKPHMVVGHNNQLPS